MQEIIILVIAAAIDLLLGDPPDAVHPVAWMGKVVSLLEKAGLQFDHAGQFFYGMAMTLFITAVFAVPAYFILLYLEKLNLVAATVLAAVLLKLMFSVKGLRRAALAVRDNLQDDRPEKVRHELRTLVSRDTAGLTRPLLVSSAVESVAEGLCDSIVAPLFYFLLFGIPGAIAYRVVNTLDSMIGYHGKYEYLGKFAGILDDVLNFIPARLAALLVTLAAAKAGKTGLRAWRTAFDEHVLTESPNAGWPMAAMAGALGVRLEKPGHYVLGGDNAEPSVAAIDDSVKLLLLSTGAWLLICCIVGVIEFVTAT